MSGNVFLWPTVIVLEEVSISDFSMGKKFKLSRNLRTSKSGSVPYIVLLSSSNHYYTEADFGVHTNICPN